MTGCEDAQNAYILRMYDAEGNYTKASLTFAHDAKRITECNMLEEEIASADADKMVFKPFEIKTVKVEY